MTNDALEEVKAKLPETAMITQAVFEGADIVFYTKNKSFFLEGDEKVKQLVAELRKRIDIRADAILRMDPDDAKKAIMEIVPKEAEVKDILFEPEFGCVIILSQKPGLVIGKAGETIRQIKAKTFWVPKVQRVPLFSSDIVNRAREIVHQEAAYRQKFLNRIGEKIQLKKGAREGWVRISFLGGGREVGRSCLLVQTKESRVLLDCGLGMTGNVAPHIDAPEFDIDRLDAIVIAHSHLDHSGWLPYLYEYEYKGPVYCTTPTRDVMTLLQLDYIDVMQRETGKAPYTSEGIKKAIKHSITLDYGEVCDITPDMRLTLQNSGHILGSALIHLHVGEGLHNILYTSDMKFAPTWLFEPASTAFTRVETLILEGTYGAARDIMPSRSEADTMLMDVIGKTLARGGKVVIPCFSIGRSQEIMVVLADEAMRGKFNAPVYLDGMIWDATAIHTTYPEFLSHTLQRSIFHQGINPFTAEIFKNVKGSTERKKVIDEKTPSVILTTSGMLTGGPVMEYLRYLGPDKKNTLIFVGYQSEGTLGSKLQKGWRDIPLSSTEDDKRQILKIEMDVTTVEGYSGHSDRNQLINYVSRLRSRPERILLNHGELAKLLELSRSLHTIFKVETAVPHNLDAIRLR